MGQHKTIIIFHFGGPFIDLLKAWIFIEEAPAITAEQINKKRHLKNSGRRLCMYRAIVK